MSGMHVLITGCAGRVGRAVAGHLLQQGFAVRGVDLVDPELDGVDFRRCDLLERGAVDRELDGIEAVLHLAAIPAPGLADNRDIFQLNTAGTYNVFHACAGAAIGRVVAASSINAIGYFFGSESFELEYLPVDEAHFRRTSDPYSFSKQVTEDIGDYFWRRDGISNTCLRFGAGLRRLDEMRQHQGASLAQVRERIEALLAMPREAQQVTLAGCRRIYDARRKKKVFESRAGFEGLSDVDRQMMTMRHNLFSFVELGDACKGMELALTAAYDGSHPLFIVDGTNAVDLVAPQLALAFYPDVRQGALLKGRQGLVSPQKARQLIGFETSISASALFE